MGLVRTLIDYTALNYRFKHWSLKRIERHQLTQIKKTIHYAKKHSPFYRDLYQDITIKSFNDLEKLPIINKTIMMEHFTTFNTCGLDYEDVSVHAIKAEKDKDYLGYYQNRYVIGMSSGTSGNKGLFITPKSLTKRLPGVFLARGGCSLKDLPLRIIFLLRVFSQGFDDINAPMMTLNYVSTMTPPQDIIKRINDLNANIIMAPPSLLRFLLPLKETLNVQLKRVITYAEVLTEVDKQQFKEAFNTQVVEIYQASEGQMASPCNHGSLHINEDLVHIDIRDEHHQPVTLPNKVGHKMIITNLINKAQPLIRYEMNDMIVLDTPCPCGSSFRRIKKVLGRHDDLIYFKNNQSEKQVVFPDLFVRWIITESEAIREFQVIQESIGAVTIYVDAIEPIDQDKLKQNIIKELNALGLNGEIHIEEKAIQLPEDKNKFKRFIQKATIL